MIPPRFKYYLDGYFIEKPEPIFALWMPGLRAYSDVSGEKVMAAGRSLPLFPDYKTWRRLVLSKRRCGRCWASTRGIPDLLRHLKIHHMDAPIHLPASGDGNAEAKRAARGWL